MATRRALWFTDAEPILFQPTMAILQMYEQSWLKTPPSEYIRATGHGRRRTGDGSAPGSQSGSGSTTISMGLVLTLVQLEPDINHIGKLSFRVKQFPSEFKEDMKEQLNKINPTIYSLCMVLQRKMRGVATQIQTIGGPMKGATPYQDVTLTDWPSTHQLVAVLRMIMIHHRPYFLIEAQGSKTRYLTIIHESDMPKLTEFWESQCENIKQSFQEHKYVRTMDDIQKEEASNPNFGGEFIISFVHEQPQQTKTQAEEELMNAILNGTL